VSFLGNVAHYTRVGFIHSRAFGDRGSVPQHTLCGGLTGIGCTAATLLLSLRYPTCNPCFHANQEHKRENEFMSIAAAQLITARLQGQRTARVCHLLPRRTIGGFGCRLVLCRHKAADVVLTSELLYMAAEREATTFSRRRERSCANTRPSHPGLDPKARGRMPNTSRTAYIFQYKGEDLYAVSHDITGGNIPRSPCTLGWRLCEECQLGPCALVPAPIMPEPIVKGIAAINSRTPTGAQQRAPGRHERGDRRRHDDAAGRWHTV
jgi:hypothetical protein